MEEYDKVTENATASRRLARLGSLPALGVVLFIFSTSFPPLDLITQINLSVHMAQHALIVISGVFIAYPIYVKWKSIGKKVPDKNLAIMAIPVTAAIVIFWHLPSFWDAAVLNPLVHATEHFSFLIVGLLIGFFFPIFPDNLKFMSIFLAASAHMAYGLYLFVMTSAVYPLYPVSQQTVLAMFLLFPSPAYFVSMIAISLHRETERLERLDEASSIQIERGSSVISQGKPKKWRLFLRSRIIPILTLVLIVLFAGYVVLAAGMIYLPSAAASVIPMSSPTISKVIIEETPITWNYAPENIIVVLGVNNTVTWISHSLSEDTVSSTAGIFDSGIIHPGQTWSYTFTKPGVYSYDCEFHPWMKGTVTVLAPTSR